MVNTWSADALAEMEAAEARAAMERAGLEAEAPDLSDSEDEAEAAAPHDEIYPRKRLRIRQVDEEPKDENAQVPTAQSRPVTYP